MWEIVQNICNSSFSGLLKDKRFVYTQPISSTHPSIYLGRLSLLNESLDYHFLLCSDLHKLSANKRYKEQTNKTMVFNGYAKLSCYSPRFCPESLKNLRNKFLIQKTRKSRQTNAFNRKDIFTVKYLLLDKIHSSHLILIFYYNKLFSSFQSYSTEVYFLDNELYIQAQNNWLIQDLTSINLNRTAHPWIVAFGHRPMYCSSGDDCATSDSKVRKGYV